MNLRDIKKDIEYVIGAFIDDCSLFSAVNPKADDEALGKLLDEAVNLYNSPVYLKRQLAALHADLFDAFKHLIGTAAAIVKGQNGKADLKDEVNIKVEGKKSAHFAEIRKELLEKTDALYASLSEVVKKSEKPE